MHCRPLIITLSVCFQLGLGLKTKSNRFDHFHMLDGKRTSKDKLDLKDIKNLVVMGGKQAAPKNEKREREIFI